MRHSDSDTQTVNTYTSRESITQYHITSCIYRRAAAQHGEENNSATYFQCDMYKIHVEGEVNEVVYLDMPGSIVETSGWGRRTN